MQLYNEENIKQYEQETFSIYLVLLTLESRIVVPVRLLIFEKFSHQYTLIPASTFIHFRELLNGLKTFLEKNNL